MSDIMFKAKIYIRKSTNLFKNIRSTVLTLTETWNVPFSQYDMNAACSCSHTPSTVWNVSCKALNSDAIFSLVVSSAKKRRPHPTDSALKVHGEITPTPSQHHLWGSASETLQYWMFFSLICHRMQTWLACWVQVLLGIWRTWAWPSPTSPVPVPSSLSSCLRSSSSTSGPPR